MSQPELGRAHLLHILVHLPEAEWPAAARAAGFKLRAEAPEAKPGQAQSAAPASAPGPTPAPETAPYRPGDLPDQPFWRVAAQRLLSEEEWPTGAPSWLDEVEPWCAVPQSNPDIPPPPLQALTPRARQARFLRRQLAIPQRGGGIDLARLCGQLAQRRIPARLPRLAQSAWPGRVRLVLDLSPTLRPYQSDFWRWAAQLQHTLGQRLQRFVTRSGHPGETVAAETGHFARLTPQDGPLVILGDAGLYAPDSPRHKAWREFGQRCARQGVRPLLLAPCPARYLSAEMTAWFSCVLLERGANLHPLPKRRNSAGCLDARAPAPSPASADLLAALSLGARTEPPLLRSLRLSLAERGADIGCEYEVWNHPDVYSDELACALRPGPRGEALRAFGQLPAHLQQTLAQRRSKGNRHLSPLVILEENLVGGEWLGGEVLKTAQEDAEKYAATLFDTTGQGMKQPLSAFIAALGRRRPELLARCPKLALAWGLAHRDKLASGQLPALPKGMGLQQIAWLMAEDHAPRRPVFLGQVADGLGLFEQGNGAPLCPLADLESDARCWQLEPAQPERGDAVALAFGETHPLRTDQAYRLTVGRHRLELDAVRRPEWAVGMGRDRDGLFAELPDGRRVYWVARGQMLVESESGRTVQEFPLPHGYWWAEAEHRAWIKAGKRFERPDWAARHGVDQSGWWAEFEVKNVAQRMRWIPPGEFLMGSPPEEVERSSDDSEWSEIQHPVLLTEGYWLADTACTQALWRAVMGDNPSGFKGEDRPVEKVSWQDISERFLPALNTLAPGLEAVLPSEAQWEYACRAGTTTPFWFGEDITPEQVNYDGNYPYRSGEKGLYREQTVAVKALPANGWGLYQMHGNVLEWCADWLAPYASDVATDPAVPPSGRARVLRGGSWINDGGYCRSAKRFGNDPGFRSDDFGFRLARGSSPRQVGSAGVAGVAAGSGATAAAPDSLARRAGRAVKKIFGMEEKL